MRAIVYALGGVVIAGGVAYAIARARMTAEEKLLADAQAANDAVSKQLADAHAAADKANADAAQARADAAKAEKDRLSAMAYAKAHAAAVDNAIAASPDTPAMSFGDLANRVAALYKPVVVPDSGFTLVQPPPASTGFGLFDMPAASPAPAATATSNYGLVDALIGFISPPTPRGNTILVP